MILEIYSRLKNLPANNQWLAVALSYLPVLIEVLATVWVITYYSFDPIIPVYQGY